MGDTGATRLEQAQNNLRKLQGDLQDLLAKRELLNRELSSTPALLTTESEMVLGPNGQPVGISRDPRVEAAQRDLDDLKLRYTDNHPDVMAARKRLDSIKAQVSEQAAANAAAVAAAAKERAAQAAKNAPNGLNGPQQGGGNADGAKDGGNAPKADGAGQTRPTRSVANPVYEQLKVRMIEGDGQISSLQRQIAEATRERDRMEEMARSAPGVQAEYINLNRDYDVVRRNYDELLGRRESMRIATAAEADADKIKIQIIDPPQVPQNPVAPKRGQLMSAVFIAGLVAGVGLAVLLVQFDQSFHTIDELRDLGLPVAGGVSMLNVTVTRGRLASIMLFVMSLALLWAVYAGLLYRMLHTPGVV
jgi:uncharacterized protein involved in exopolysaccharide biosynthesis